MKGVKEAFIDAGEISRLKFIKVRQLRLWRDLSAGLRLLRIMIN